jgi:hypothetical protein
VAGGPRRLQKVRTSGWLRLMPSHFPFRILKMLVGPVCLPLGLRRGGRTPRRRLERLCACSPSERWPSVGSAGRIPGGARHVACIAEVSLWFQVQLYRAGDYVCRYRETARKVVPRTFPITNHLV